MKWTKWTCRCVTQLTKVCLLSASIQSGFCSGVLVFLFVCNLVFLYCVFFRVFSYFKHNTNLLNTFLYFLVQNIRFHHSYFVSFYSHDITFSKSEKASPFCNRIMRLKINDSFTKSLNEWVLFMLIDHLTCMLHVVVSVGCFC